MEASTSTLPRKRSHLDSYLDQQINARRNFHRSVDGDIPPKTQNLPSLQGAELTKYRYDSDRYELDVRQLPHDFFTLDPEKPRTGRKTTGKKPVIDRHAFEPCPIVELKVEDNDPTRCWLQSPYLSLVAELVRVDSQESTPNMLMGVSAASLSAVKMKDGKKRGFFVFTELIPKVKAPGTFILTFRLWDMRKDSDTNFAFILNAVSSQPFRISFVNKIPPPPPSTAFTKELHEAGVKIKVKKVPIRRMNKRTNGWAIDELFSTGPMPTAVIGHQQYKQQVAYPNHYQRNGTFNVTASNATDISGRVTVQQQQTATLPMQPAWVDQLQGPMATTVPASTSSMQPAWPYQLQPLLPTTVAPATPFIQSSAGYHQQPRFPTTAAQEAPYIQCGSRYYQQSSLPTTFALETSGYEVVGGNQPVWVHTENQVPLFDDWAAVEDAQAFKSVRWPYGH